MSDTLYWAGWWDEKTEGKFINAYNEDDYLDPFHYQPWYPGEPNGNTVENCAVVRVGKNTWTDEHCTEKEMCGFCELERAPELMIRGERSCPYYRQFLFKALKAL